MATYVYQCRDCGRLHDVVKPVEQRRDPAFCPDCAADPLPYTDTRPMRRIFTVTKQIARPQGYRLRPGDRGFDDFRREAELGELREDATPLTFTPAEIARMDEMPVAFTPDQERDHQFAQLLHQHWTEDLSDDTVRKRELANAAVARGELTTEGI